MGGGGADPDPTAGGGLIGDRALALGDIGEDAARGLHAALKVRPGELVDRDALLAMAVIGVLGFLLSSQLGLAMALADRQQSGKLLAVDGFGLDGDRPNVAAPCTT